MDGRCIPGWWRSMADRLKGNIRSSLVARDREIHLHNNRSCRGSLSNIFQFSPRGGIRTQAMPLAAEEEERGIPGEMDRD